MIKDVEQISNIIRTLVNDMNNSYNKDKFNYFKKDYLTTIENLKRRYLALENKHYDFINTVTSFDDHNPFFNLIQKLEFMAKEPSERYIREIMVEYKDLLEKKAKAYKVLEVQKRQKKAM